MESSFYAYLRYSSPVCPLRLPSWKAYFMHIYGTPAHFAHLGCHLGKQFLCIFTVLQPTLASQVAILEHIFYAYLRYSSLLCPLRLPSWKAELMHIYGTPAHFSYTALVPEWLSDGLRKLILSCSGLWCQNGPQMASGGSFWAVLGSGARMALRWPLESHFELFWALVPEGLSDGLLTDDT